MDSSGRCRAAPERAHRRVGLDYRQLSREHALDHTVLDDAPREDR
jgi:hypothetical protein